MTGDRASSVAIADLNGDAIPDLAVANGGSDDVSVLLGNSDGTFQTEQRFAAGGLPWSIAIADLNCDEIADIAVANYFDDDASVLLGHGDGTFQTQQRFPVGNEPRSIAINDLNGDGIVDLAVVNMDNDSMSLLYGNGDGYLSAQRILPGLERSERDYHHRFERRWYFRSRRDPSRRVTRSRYGSATAMGVSTTKSLSPQGTGLSLLPVVT